MEEYTAQEDRIMKNASIIATALSGLIVMTSPLFAGERVFRVGKAGYLTNTNRFAFAEFSECTISFREVEGVPELPCRFVFQSKSGCEQIDFSSVRIESKICDSRDDYEMTTNDMAIIANALPPLVKRMRIGFLNLEIEDYPYNVDIVIREEDPVIDVIQDCLLYKKSTEKYFRYFRSSDSDAAFWNVRWKGKCIEYRILPINKSVAEICLEDTITRSKYFSKMSLKYKKAGDGFRLSKIILWGNCSYKGRPLYSDPASLEMREMFAKSRSMVIDSDAESGIVETGCGVLKSGKSMQYNIFRQGGKAGIKVEIGIEDENASK